MRRGTMLVVGLLLASVAMPPPAAEARPLLFKILRGMTARSVRSWAPGGIAAGGRTIAPRGRVPDPDRAGRSRQPPLPRAPSGRDRSGCRCHRWKRPTGRRYGHNRIGPGPRPKRSRKRPGSPSGRNRGAAARSRPAPAQRRADGAGERTASARKRADRLRRLLNPRRPRAQFRLGTVGPLAWPTAYEDVIGFTLWPKEYGERLRVHGIGDVLSTAFAPSASVAARMRANAQQARADEPNSAPVVPTCGSVDLTSSDWPIAQIASAIELDRRPARRTRSVQDRVERCGLLDQVDLPRRRQSRAGRAAPRACRMRFGPCTTRRSSSALRSPSSMTR